MKIKIAALLIILFIAGSYFVFAQNKEDVQMQFLQNLVTFQTSKWKEMIKKADAVDESFVTLCQDSAYFAILKKDMAEAYKLCFIADLSAQKLKMKDNYRLGLAYYCYNKSDYEKSLTICNLLEKENYADARLPLITGLIYKEQKNYPTALKYFEKANKVDPENYDVHYNLGLMYIETGDKEKAKQEFQKSMELNPGKKEAKKANEALEKESSANTSLSSLISEAKKAIEENRKDDADKLLKQCLEVDPKNYEVYLLMGKLSAQAGDYQIALNYLQQSLNLYGDDAQVYYYTGYVYERLYDKDNNNISYLFEAKKYYGKAVDMDLKYNYAANDVQRISERIEKHNKGQETSNTTGQ